MTEIEIAIKRDVLNQVIKRTIGRIKELQNQLVIEKKERHELGSYSDCGEFYQEQVTRTESIIEELIKQKITFEKWRKKLMF